MNPQAEKPKFDLTLVVLAILILQVILLAGLLVRINQVYVWTIESGATGKTTDISLVQDVSPDDDPYTGPATAPVTIVEFADFGCGSCSQVQATLAQVRESYGDRVRIVFRDFPLEEIGSSSFMAALGAECANEQGAFWAMHDLLFNKQPVFDRGSIRSYAVSLGLDMDQFDSCMESNKYQDEINHDHDDGASYGVASTPTFFVNGHRLVGSVPFSAFQQAIEESLQGR